MADHKFAIRVLSTDGEIISIDSDFREDARYDFFETVVNTSDAGDVVQLIDTSDDCVLAEEIAGE